MSATPETRVVRLALAAASACTTALALYALLRVAQALLFPEPDPAQVLWSEHAGYFWRVWTVAYVGGMAGFIAWLAAGRDPRGVARVVARAVAIAALLVSLQAILVP